MTHGVLALRFQFRITILLDYERVCPLFGSNRSALIQVCYCRLDVILDQRSDDRFPTFSIFPSPECRCVLVADDRARFWIELDHPPQFVRDVPQVTHERTSLAFFDFGIEWIT